ncbi:MAG: hypothetical protein LIR31_02060 [Bacteroidota bacterium]|nr:hypothetical protein [Bacteroidota bacterium]
MQIATVLKSNGTDGELLIGFKGFSAQDIDTKEPVFIEFDGLPVPYFIENINPKGTSKALVRLTGITTLDESEELCGRAVSVRPEDYPDLEEEESLEDLIGWTLLDEKGLQVGPIVGVEDIPGNPCIEVRTKKGQYLLPLNEELILSVNPESEILQMRIPEGLINS